MPFFVARVPRSHRLREAAAVGLEFTMPAIDDPATISGGVSSRSKTIQLTQARIAALGQGPRLFMGITSRASEEPDEPNSHS